jgi:hypothetical protein
MRVIHIRFENSHDRPSLVSIDVNHTLVVLFVFVVVVVVVVDINIEIDV